MQYKSENPYTNELYTLYDYATKNEIIQQIELLHVSQMRWKAISLSERAKYIQILIVRLEASKQELAELITYETGKPISQSIEEINKCIHTIQYFYLNAEKLLQTEILDDRAIIQYEPLGVILGIMPWNFPLWQVVRFAIPTLLAGNTILLKHAPNTPRVAAFIHTLFDSIFENYAVLINVYASIDDIELIIANKFIQGASITGSTNAGRSVAAICGKHIKKCVLELGGSDPFIVSNDANIAKAASIAAESRCRNNGQSCVAAKRFIIHENVVDDFIHNLIIVLKEYKHGNPADTNTFMSCLARTDLLDKAKQQMELLSNKYELIYDGGNVRYPFPRIYKNNDSDIFADSFTEELFAPVFIIETYTNIEDAIQKANNTDYGLGASVHTTNPNEIKLFCNSLDCGMIFFNEMTQSKADLPFGGIKQSGIGKELGALGIKEFTNQKLIKIENGRS